MANPTHFFGLLLLVVLPSAVLISLARHFLSKNGYWGYYLVLCVVIFIIGVLA